jgi:hypothetical protein
VTIKCTMFFEAFRYSWSESHYLIGIDQFATAVTPAGVLASARAGCLGVYAKLVAVRLSAVPANRQVYELPLNDFLQVSQQLSNPAGFNSQADAAFTALMLNLANNSGNKNLYLAGVPDDIVEFLPSTSNGYRPTANFTTALNQYMSVLTTQVSGFAWGFRSRDPQPHQNVIEVGTQAGFGNNAGVTTAANPGVPVGSEAYLKGFKVINPRLPSLAGAYQVIGVIPPGSGNPNWITVLGETGNVEGSNFEALGYIQPLAFTYIPYARWRVVRVTHRKRGGSFDSPRGRSRVRR